MEEELVKALARFEQSFVDYTEKKRSAFSLKSDYIEMKYDIVKLFLSAVEETIDFDFDKFIEEQKNLPLLKNEVWKKDAKIQ